MKNYNPNNTITKLNPEQQAIRDFRNTEYQRKYGIKSEDKINQDTPNPKGEFQVQLQALARELVETASDLTNKKKRGKVDNYDYAARMALIERSVGELGAFANTTEKAMASYNENLQNHNSQFEQILNITCIPNRLVLFDSSMLHRSNGLGKIEKPRIIQTFFFGSILADSFPIPEIKRY